MKPRPSSLTRLQKVSNERSVRISPLDGESFLSCRQRCPLGSNFLHGWRHGGPILEGCPHGRKTVKGSYYPRCLSPHHPRSTMPLPQLFPTISHCSIGSAVIVSRVLSPAPPDRVSVNLLRQQLLPSSNAAEPGDGGVVPAETSRS